MITHTLKYNQTIRNEFCIAFYRRYADNKNEQKSSVLMKNRIVNTETGRILHTELFPAATMPMPTPFLLWWCSWSHCTCFAFNSVLVVNERSTVTCWSQLTVSCLWLVYVFYECILIGLEFTLNTICLRCSIFACRNLESDGQLRPVITLLRDIVSEYCCTLSCILPFSICCANLAWISSMLWTADNLDWRYDLSKLKC